MTELYEWSKYGFCNNYEYEMAMLRKYKNYKSINNVIINK